MATLSKIKQMQEIVVAMALAIYSLFSLKLLKCLASWCYFKNKNIGSHVSLLDPKMLGFYLGVMKGDLLQPC